MFKIYKIIVALIFSLTIFSSFSYSEIAKKIEVKGNDRISTETIILFSQVKVNDNISEIELNNIIKNLFETNYFKNVEASIVDNKLVIIVDENSIIGNIDFEGVKSKRIQN